MNTKLTRKQVYKKYNIDVEKQKFLDNTPLHKIIYYEELNKSLTKKSYAFDEEHINKHNQRCKKCQKTNNCKIWKNCLDFKNCYPQNEEGAMFKNAYGCKEWIPWSSLK